MKLLIVSDTHGRHERLEAAIKKEKPFDMMLHLGDVEGQEEYIEALVDCPVKFVKGNNDFYSDLPDDLTVQAGDMKIFMTHGHMHSVYYGTAKIEQMARSKGANVAIYGHTHMPVIDKQKDMLILCPGSIEYPRQMGRRPSYVIIKTDEKGAISAKIHYL